MQNSRFREIHRFSHLNWLFSFRSELKLIIIFSTFNAHTSNADGNGSYCDIGFIWWTTAFVKHTILNWNIRWRFSNEKSEMHKKEAVVNLFFRPIKYAKKENDGNTRHTRFVAYFVCLCSFESFLSTTLNWFPLFRFYIFCSSKLIHQSAHTFPFCIRYLSDAKKNNLKC